MKGGQQTVAVGKLDQHFLAGIGNRRVMAQVMSDGLQIATDPREPLTAKGGRMAPASLRINPICPAVSRG